MAVGVDLNQPQNHVAVALAGRPHGQRAAAIASKAALVMAMRITISSLPLPIDAIAALVGVSRTTIQNALRQARHLGLLEVKERAVGSAVLPIIAEIQKSGATTLRAIADGRPSDPFFAFF